MSRTDLQLTGTVLSRYLRLPSPSLLASPDRSLRTDQSMASSPLPPQQDTTNVAVTQKRKGDDLLARANSHSRAKFRKTQSATHTTRSPIRDDDDFFSSDQITSDPTFFDDFMPVDSRASPRRHLPPAQVKHIPIAKNRDPESEQVHAESLKESAFPDVGGDVSRKDGIIDLSVLLRQDSQGFERSSNNVSQEPLKVKSADQMTTESKHQEPSEARKEHFSTNAQEQPGANISRERRDGYSGARVLSSTTETSSKTARDSEDPVAQANDQIGAQIEQLAAEDTNTSKSVNPQTDGPKEGAVDSSRLVVQQAISPSDTVLLQTPISNVIRKPVRTPRTKQSPALRLNTPGSVEVKARSKCSVARTASTTVTRTLKRTPVKPNGLQFEISDTQTGRAFLVKHRKEAKSEIGNQWSRATKRASIYTSITKHARIKYTVDEIVSLDFLEGHGGSAKILEIRETDMTYVVVQWLYSRTDAARLGGKLPPLDKWPKGFYALSDHFQVVCLENVDGKSASTAIEDVYWQVSTRCLRPLNELHRHLHQQDQAD